MKIHRWPDLSGPLYHYNNTVVLRFSPKSWLYVIEDKNGSLTPIDGVTGTLKIVDKSAALIGWSTKLFLTKAIELAQQHRRGEFIEAEWGDFCAMLAFAKDEHKRVLEAAGDTGHSAHAFVESLVKATMADNEPRRLEVLAKFPEDERATNAAIAAVAFFSDHNVRYIAAEQRVLSLEWLVAGTMDGDILIDSCDRAECPCQTWAPFKDKRVVLDLKTSNQIVPTYFAQAAFYRKAKEEEFPDIKFEGTVILRLGKDDAQEFEPWFTFGDEYQARHLRFFKEALDLKHSVEQTEADMRMVKEFQKKKEKEARDAEKLARDKVRCSKAETYKGSRLSKCLPDGTQCEACRKIYLDKHPEAVIQNEDTILSVQSLQEANSASGQPGVD